MKILETNEIPYIVNAFPALGLVRAAWKWHDAQGNPHRPGFRVIVLDPLPDDLCLRADNISIDGPKVLQHPTDKDWRGSMTQYAQAIGEDERVLATMRWEHPMSQKETIGDIFKYIAPTDDVKCLFWITGLNCYQLLPAPEGEPVEQTLVQVGAQVVVTIIPRPKSGGWTGVLESRRRDQDLLNFAGQLMDTARVDERATLFDAFIKRWLGK